MNRGKFVNLLIYILSALFFLVVIIKILTGENGLINQEKEKYNQTHIQEIQEKHMEEQEK